MTNHDSLPGFNVNELYQSYALFRHTRLHHRAASLHDHTQLIPLSSLTLHIATHLLRKLLLLLLLDNTFFTQHTCLPTTAHRTIAQAHTLRIPERAEWRQLCTRRNMLTYRFEDVCLDYWFSATIPFYYVVVVGRALLSHWAGRERDWLKELGREPSRITLHAAARDDRALSTRTVPLNTFPKFKVCSLSILIEGQLMEGDGLVATNGPRCDDLEIAALNTRPRPAASALILALAVGVVWCHQTITTMPRDGIDKQVYAIWQVIHGDPSSPGPLFRSHFFLNDTVKHKVRWPRIPSHP
jgi:hypothetical protein